jgi:hypothetical protein
VEAVRAVPPASDDRVVYLKQNRISSNKLEHINVALPSPVFVVSFCALSLSEIPKEQASNSHDSERQRNIDNRHRTLR